MDWILFKHVGTLNHYFWNGTYPINVTHKGVPWQDDAIVTPTEIKAITSVVGNRKRTFTIKGRGNFAVIEKGTSEEI